MNWDERNRFQRSLRTMLEVAHRLDTRGFVAAGDGNISVRFERDYFLVTRTGAVCSRISPLDILIVGEDGERRDHPLHPRIPPAYCVTSEWRMHRALYESRPDISAVIHAHPPFTTAFAAARKPLPAPVLPELITTIGTVPLVSYQSPGSEVLAQAVADVARKCDVVMLANHGVVAVADDILTALDNLERTEHSAKILLFSRLVDEPVMLSPAETQALRELFRR